MQRRLGTPELKHVAMKAEGMKEGGGRLRGQQRFRMAASQPIKCKREKVYSANLR